MFVYRSPQGAVGEYLRCVINRLGQKEISERHFQLVAQFDELIDCRRGIAGHPAGDMAVILGGELAGGSDSRHPFPYGSGHGYLRGSTHGAP